MSSRTNSGYDSLGYASSTTATPSPAASAAASARPTRVSTTVLRGQTQQPQAPPRRRANSLQANSFASTNHRLGEPRHSLFYSAGVVCAIFSLLQIQIIISRIKNQSLSIIIIIIGKQHSPLARVLIVTLRI